MLHRATRFVLCAVSLAAVGAVVVAQPTARPARPTAFVAPAASEKVADAPRPATPDAGWGRKFATENTRPTVTIANPYMDPARPLFAKAESLRCAADGSVVVSGRAGFDADARPLAAGFWRIAPDGAVTPLHARAESLRPSRTCGAPFAQTAAAPKRFSLGADGRILFAGPGSIQGITAAGAVSPLAGSAGDCSYQGKVGAGDGAAAAAGFNEADRPVEDTDGNLWVADQKWCALRRISKDGQVTTVLGADVVCNETVPREDRPVLTNLEWDAVHGELVTAGAFTVARPVHDLYTVIWRIKPDGTYRRVLFGKKATRISPAKAHLDGIRAMAVDGKGRIHIISDLMLFEQRGFDALQLLRVDEVNATVVPITGAKIPKGTWLAGHPMDGPSPLAYFQYSRDLCFAPDGTAYVNDEMLIRRIDPTGQVTTWAF
jgi:hypothetical protein